MDSTATKLSKEWTGLSKMDDALLRAASSRFTKLAHQFGDKEFRDSYVAALTRRFLARQMKKFRGDASQTEFAARLDKQQTIVSRLENPNYSGWTLGTLLEIASKLDVGLVVRFVDFPSFMKATEDFSETALRPASYSQQQVEDFAQSEADFQAAAARALEILQMPLPEQNAGAKDNISAALKPPNGEGDGRG